MKKFKKVLSVIAALSLVTSSVCSYAGAEETPLKSANWETTYTHVPNGPSNTGHTETWFVECGTSGNTVNVSTISNKIAGDTGYANVNVTDNGYKMTTLKLTSQGSKHCKPLDSADRVPRAAHFKFSSYTSYSGNTFTAKGNIIMYPTEK